VPYERSVNPCLFARPQAVRERASRLEGDAAAAREKLVAAELDREAAITARRSVEAALDVAESRVVQMQDKVRAPATQSHRVLYLGALGAGAGVRCRVQVQPLPRCLSASARAPRQACQSRPPSSLNLSPNSPKATQGHRALGLICIRYVV
jgi:hypothetical protein